jgi:hypothetical protein
LIQLFNPLDRAHPSNAMNALKLHLMSAAERLDEIAEILAAGLMRVRAKQSSPQSADHGDCSLDCADHQSADRLNRTRALGGLSPRESWP